MRSLILKPNLLNIQKTLLMLMVVISLFNCGSNLTANSEGNSLLNNVQKSSDINKSDKADISYCFTDDPRDYTIATQYNEMGQGDAEEPFRIYTAAQLFSISRNVYALDKHYELCQDIDLDDFYGFGLGQNNFSIGSESYPFTGVFDGKQHQIISFNYDENANYYVDAGVYPVRALDRANTVLRNSSHQVGLFGKTLGAEIRNLQLARVEIRVANSDKVAALIGDASDTQVMEVRIEGNLKDAYNKNTIAARNEVGGLLGYGSNSRIDNSYSKVNLAGNDKLGGLVGASRELAILSIF